ncbi:DNA mismatch repair protein MutT [Longispora fulva]|uniref:8-oxo-dGTP pyrophosphatase MutT (NUDIX family) n=1 Tax=Longispora fulva TaxID=619741 RepID=A0A8J7GCG6_9ACTN|nr:NUDIX domain-containing protein [Longispora fulva]MBG6136059.1 8-oxo-dGTP pyrophosphatase MutT (NUDIX family) [Longispora fulva]GIG55699.1 DNA mismatch repair protein MutT [Longispora fulva]
MTARRDQTMNLSHTEATLRADLTALIAAITPGDAVEEADLRHTLEWVASGYDLYRTAKPATPPQHLVAYFQVIDPDTGLMLLGEHRGAGLLLPNGGHVEPGEKPWQAVVRECREELHASAEPSPRFGTRPAFVSVTRTRGPAAGQHVDVSLWHVVHVERESVSYFDPAEFTAMHWMGPREILMMQAERLDPCMHRFTRKITQS